MTRQEKLNAIKGIEQLVDEDVTKCSVVKWLLDVSEVIRKYIPSSKLDETILRSFFNPTLKPADRMYENSFCQKVDSAKGHLKIALSDLKAISACN